MADAQRSASALPRVTAPRRTALVVDDEAELADSLADILSLLGYAVTTAPDGAAATAALEQRSFDLIVSDVRMPGIDGPALFAWLREHRPDLVGAVAFSTGDTLSDAAARFLSGSGRPFMEKPFSLGSVRALVEQVAAGRTA